MHSKIKQVRSPSREARSDRDFKAGSKIRSSDANIGKDRVGAYHTSRRVCQMTLFASKGFPLKVVMFILALSISHIVSGCVTCSPRSFINILKKTTIEDINYDEIRFEDVITRLFKSSNRKLSERGEYGIGVIVDATHLPNGFMDMKCEIHFTGLSIYDAFYELARQTGITVEYNGKGLFNK